MQQLLALCVVNWCGLYYTADAGEPAVKVTYAAMDDDLTDWLTNLKCAVRITRFTTTARCCVYDSYV